MRPGLFISINIHNPLFFPQNEGLANQDLNSHASVGPKRSSSHGTQNPFLLTITLALGVFQLILQTVKHTFVPVLLFAKL